MPPLNGPQPFLNGYPIMGKSATRGNHVASAMASMISGVTRIRNTVAIKTLVQTPGRRASATPAKPPSMTAKIVAPNAAMNELRIESPILAKSKTVSYQSVDIPFTTKANKNAAGPDQFNNLREIFVVRINTVRATTEIMNKAANRTNTAQATEPLNNSSHHFTPALPDQIVKELPPLNEWNTTSKIGINKNTKTRAVQMVSAMGKTSKLKSVPFPSRMRPRDLA